MATKSQEMENSTVKNERRTMAPKRNKKRSSSLPSADFGGSYCELVKTELDAVYALAEFAQVVQRDGEGCLVKQWGGKGRRKRSYKTGSMSQRSSSELTLTVKEECHPVVAETPLEIYSTCQQAAKAHTAEKEESDGKPPTTCHSVQLKNVKFEPTYDTPNVQPKISIPAYQHGNKVRQPLTEIEKEARRLRRVQANRESARKTIRRKQALRDELSQKAAQLAHENETMKQQTELVMQEYNSLKDRNKQLKEQMSSTSRDQACKTPADSKVSYVQTSDLPSTQTPLICGNEIPLPPFLRATAFIQASSPTQTLAPENKQHVIPMENTTLPTTYGNMMSNLWTDPYGNSQWHVPPLFLPYMLPFSPGGQPFALHAKKPPPIATAACASSACESGSNTYVRADGDNILVEAKVERMPRSRDPDSPKNQMLQESSIDRPLQKSGIKPQTHMFERAISVLPINTSSSSLTLSNGKELLHGGLPYDKHTLNHLGSGNWSLQSKEPPNPQICHSFPNMGRNLPTCVREDSVYLEKKLLGAAAASDARKRRKELTRNKHIQARQLKLHC